MDFYLLMRTEVDEVDYSQVLSLSGFRHCSVFWGRRYLLRLCLGEDFDRKVIIIIYSSLESLGQITEPNSD